ncbi:MAG: hypothetical protein K2V38_26900 [Gemmataceae bacterium]|nr:hypothetical protein [Gemmataceae bacterium]
MLSLTHVVIAVVAVVPIEYEIDCSTWPGKAGEFAVRLVARDGTALNVEIEATDDTTPRQVRNLIKNGIRGNGDWTFTLVGDDRLRVSGVKSPLRAVEVKSPGWVPGVRVVVVPPKPADKK